MLVMDVTCSAIPRDATLRRERRRTRMRHELAKVAVELFTKNGFETTTVDEIANVADYSQSTFFRLFNRKEDVVFYDLPERIEAMRADFAAPNHHSAWTTIRDAFLNNARTWETSDAEFALARVRLFHREPALIARYLEYCLDWEDAVADIVAKERGVVSGSDLTSRLVAGCAVAAFRAAFRAVLADPAVGLTAHLESAFDEIEKGLPVYRSKSHCP